MRIGDKLKGVVTGLQPLWTFVGIRDRGNRFNHILKSAVGYIDNIHDILKIGDQVCTQVIDIDEYSGKLACPFEP